MRGVVRAGPAPACHVLSEVGFEPTDGLTPARTWSHPRVTSHEEGPESLACADSRHSARHLAALPYDFPGNDSTKGTKG